MPSLNPYLSFKNEAREAMTFYQSVFGGDLTIDTFGQYEGMVQDPAENDLVMHAQLETPDGFTLMGADTPTGMPYEKPAGISVSVSGDDEAALQGFWDKLADGGTVTMPFDTPAVGRPVRHAHRPLRHRLDGRGQRARSLRPDGPGVPTRRRRAAQAFRGQAYSLSSIVDGAGPSASSSVQRSSGIGVAASCSS